MVAAEGLGTTKDGTLKDTPFKGTTMGCTQSSPLSPSPAALDPLLDLELDSKGDDSILRFQLGTQGLSNGNTVTSTINNKFIALECTSNILTLSTLEGDSLKSSRSKDWAICSVDGSK